MIAKSERTLTLVFELYETNEVVVSFLGLRRSLRLSGCSIGGPIISFLNEILRTLQKSWINVNSRDGMIMLFQSGLDRREGEDSEGH